LQQTADVPARHLRTALIALAVCFALNMLGRGMSDTYTVFLLPLQHEFGWSRSQLTGVYSLYLLVSGFTSPLVGHVFDRLGARWVYTAGLALLGSAFFVAGSLHLLWQFYLLVGAAVGVGAALTGMVPASGLLSRWYRARLSVAIGVVFSAVGAGAITLVPLSQWLVEHYGWQSAYRVLGGLLFAALPVVLFAVPWRAIAAGHPQHRAEARDRSLQSGWTLRAALRARIYWAMAQAFFCTAVAMFVVIVQTVAFLIDAGFSPLTAASAFGFVGMLSVASVTGSGLLTERFGYRQTVSASFVGTATGIVLLMVLAGRPSTGLLVAYVAVFGLCQGVRGPIISSVCTRYFAGPRVATIYGTIYAMNALGAAVGSFMGGVLHDLSGGYRSGFGFALCFVGLAAAPFWTVRELREFR
jgi:MFS family permease